MNKIIGMMSIPFMMLLLSQQAFSADAGVIGFVNINELFNSSSYVKKANKELQDNVKKMDASMKKDQMALQDKIKQYQTMKNETKKKSIIKEITDEQARLAKLTQEYQGKVQIEQNKGMDKFSELVKTATQTVAKAKDIHHVLNNTALVYTDEAWVDLTKDVAAEMEKQ